MSATQEMSSMHTSTMFGYNPESFVRNQVCANDETIERASILVEIIFWGFYFFAHSQILSRVFYNYFSKQKYWESLSTRHGTFQLNAQDDITVTLVVACHHLLGGTVMLIGSIFSNEHWFKHGYLIETGFEAYDLLALVFRLYPYNSIVDINPKLIVGMVFHHLAGLPLVLPILMNHMNRSAHLQKIGASLLLAGGVTLATKVYTQTLDFNTQMRKVAAVNTLAYASFILARFIIFPIEIVAFYHEFPGFQRQTLIGGSCMMFFNILVLLDVTPKDIRYIMKALDQRVKLSDEPVPLSMGQKKKLLMKKKSMKLLQTMDLDEFEEVEEKVLTPRRKALQRQISKNFFSGENKQDIPEDIDSGKKTK